MPDNGKGDGGGLGGAVLGGLIQGLPIIGGTIADLATGNSNRKAQNFQNRMDRQHEEYMYGMQRRDALSDWDKQNAYNSPAQQMQRYKEAGLNPHLIYGQSNVSQPIAHTAAQASSKPAPQMPMVGHDIAGLGGSILHAFQIQAQTDNMRAQRELIEAQRQHVFADTMKIKSATDLQNFSLGQGQRFADLKFFSAQLDNMRKQSQIKNIDAQTTYTLDNNQRQKLMVASQVNKNTADVAHIYQQIVNEKLEAAKQAYYNERIQPQEKEKLEQEIIHLMGMVKLADDEDLIKRHIIELQKKGIQPGDNIWFRFMAEWADNVRNGSSMIQNYNPFTR